MFDREIVMDSLRKIRLAIETIMERANVVSDPNELLTSPGGMMRLDAICMNLIALGEAVKGLDKQTHGELLPRYPEIYWSGVMRMRDKIAHHYFEIDTDVVFRTVQEEVPQMKEVINRMIAETEGLQHRGTTTLCYEESVKIYRNLKNSIETAVWKDKVRTAREMKSDGIPTATIVKYTKLTSEEIEAL